MRCVCDDVGLRERLLGVVGKLFHLSSAALKIKAGWKRKEHSRCIRSNYQAVGPRLIFFWKCGRWVGFDDDGNNS